jgi:hypothetical protein
MSRARSHSAGRCRSELRAKGNQRRTVLQPPVSSEPEGGRNFRSVVRRCRSFPVVVRTANLFAASAIGLGSLDSAENRGFVPDHGDTEPLRYDANQKELS